MSVIHRFIGTEKYYQWQNVESQGYDVADISGVVKHVLIGPDDGAPNFIIRYFQIEPGGYSRLESPLKNVGRFTKDEVSKLQCSRIDEPSVSRQTTIFI